MAKKNSKSTSKASNKKTSPSPTQNQNPELWKRFEALLEDCPNIEAARDELAEFVQLHRVNGTDLLALEAVIEMNFSPRATLGKDEIEQIL